MIKAIIFDIGGVIVEDSNKNLYELIFKAFGIDEKIVLKEMNKHISKIDTGEINSDEFWKMVCKGIDKPFKKSYNNLWVEMFKGRKFNKDVEKIINSLKRMKYKIAILSNIIREQREYNERCGIYDKFDISVNSCDIGTRKPEKKIYKITVEKLGVKPEECVFIDDIEENVKGAENIGIKGIHFKSADQLKKELKKLGVSF